MAAHAPIPQEIEAKLLVPDVATLSDIAKLKELGPYRLWLRRTLELHTVYLDTAQFTLARQGIALRVRRDRTQWEATIKWSGREDGMIHTRPELTVRLASTPAFPFTLRPGPLADHLSELVAGQRLTPILISDTRRQRRVGGCQMTSVSASTTTPAITSTQNSTMKIEAHTIDAGFTGGIYEGGDAAFQVAGVESGYMAVPGKLEILGGFDTIDIAARPALAYRPSFGANWYVNQHRLKFQFTHREAFNVLGVRGVRGRIRAVCGVANCDGRSLQAHSLLVVEHVCTHSSKRCVLQLLIEWGGNNPYRHRMAQGAVASE
jgi:hypothetical protein